MQTLNLILRIIWMVVFLCFVSCNQGNSHINVTKSKIIESALRDLLLKQRISIEKDAPFAYEADTLSDGITIFKQGKVVIGKWVVEITGNHACAKIQKRFGKEGHFELEIIEVNLEIGGDYAKVNDWRAYTAAYTQTGGTVGIGSQNDVATEKEEPK